MDRESRIDAVLDDCLRRRLDGDPLPDSEILAEHPDLLPELALQLRKLALIQQADQIARRGSSVADDPARRTDRATIRAAAVRPEIASFAGYDLLREIHRGGQGVVYQAVQKSTKRKVAIKVMREGPFAGPADRVRFEREVQILGQLQHPNIVAIHDSGSAAGCFYFVMDYIPGHPLDVYMAGRDRPLKQTLTLFAAICDAVNAAHLRGIIHRDLKPGNVRVDPSGVPRILDFGLAKVAAFDALGGDGSPAMTLTGQFIGSLPWASPEQAEGQPSKIDVRTDVYSLGVILYQMLTGKFPYEVTGNMRDVLDRIINTEPARPSTIRKQINDEVETIVLKCLSKERERRYQSAGELSRDVGHYLAGEPVEAKRDSAMYMLRKQLRRYRTPLAVLAFIFCLVLGSAALAWTLLAESRENLRESHLGHARATRLGGLPGRRFESLALIAQAAAMGPSPAMRDEAIACLALADVKFDERRTPAELHDILEFNADLSSYFMASTGMPAFVRRTQHNVELLRMPPCSAGHAGWPAFSPDGRLVARRCADSCEIWNIVAQRRELAIPVSVDWLMEFSPDSRQLAMGTRSGELVIVDAQSGDTRRLPIRFGRVSVIAWSPSGDRLAVSSLDVLKDPARGADVIILDASSGAELQSCRHPGRVWYLAWNPADATLAAGCEDGNIYVWDAGSGELVRVLRGHSATVDRIVFDSTGEVLLSRSWDGTGRFWDARSGEETLGVTVSVRAMARGSLKWAFHDEGAEGSFGLGEFAPSRVLRSAVGSPMQTHETGEHVALSADGSLAASHSISGWRLWDLNRMRELVHVPGPETYGQAFSPDGSSLFAVVGEELVRYSIEYDGSGRHLGRQFTLCDVPGGAMEIAGAPDGRSLVMASLNGMIRSVDIRNPDGTRMVGRHPSARFLSVSPDGRMVASGTWTGSGVRVWDLSNGSLIRELPIRISADVAFSPDGRWLATSCEEHAVWDTRTWECHGRIPRAVYGSIPGEVAFSPDSKILACLRDRSTIELRDVESLEVLARLECPRPIYIRALAFTPDGNRIVFPDARGRILHVWDLAETHRELGQNGLDW